MVQIEHICGNTYCITCSGMSMPFYHLGQGRIVLMDSGLNPDGGQILDALNAAGYRITDILTSHSHFDHVGNHNLFRKQHGAKIWASRFDAAAMYSALTLQSTFVNERVEVIEQEYGYMICPVDFLFDETDSEILVEGQPFQLLHLPGHAYSHTCFVTPDQVVYLGDLMQGWQQLERSKLLYAQYWRMAIQSMHKICDTDYPFYILAHGGLIQKTAPLVQANLETLEEQLDTLLSCMDGWATRQDVMAAAIAQMTVRGRSPIRIHISERSIDAFLDYLQMQGRVEEAVLDANLYYRRARTPNKESL